MGVHVDLIVGDLDSAKPELVRRAIAAGSTVEQHPADKDATDLELSLEAVVRRGLHPTLVIGGASLDRFDHFLANALLLASPRFAPVEPRWFVQGAEVVPVSSSVSLEGRPGDIVTLLAAGGPASGVTTAGLRWPLLDETLQPGSTRGVSNVTTGSTVAVSVRTGTVLAIHLRRESQ